MDGQPSTVQPGTFIPNEAYKGLLKLVVPVDGVDEYLAPICLLGAKGVGKSATLKALHKTLGDKSTFMDLETENDVVDKINKAEGKTSRHFMLIDNIHLACNHEETIRLVRKHVKQQNTDLNLCLICAVSGDGFKAMMDHKDLKLASHHFSILVMNPEPESGKRLLHSVLETSCTLKELMSPDKMKKLEDLLGSFGWVAGEVIRLTCSLKFASMISLSDLDGLLQQFTMERITQLGGILMRDLESRGGDNYCSQALACCLYGGIGLDVLKVRKEELPWTLLKYDADKSIHQRVLPVSEMAKQSILYLLVNNTAIASDVIKLVEVLGLPTGQIRGDYFEMAVFNYITTAGIIRFEYTSCEETSTVELTSLELQKKTLYVTDVSEINEDVNACCMKGGDIILVYGKKVYFMQCSVATYENVVEKKDFMDVAQRGWIPILVTPYDLSKDLQLKRGQLALKYKANKFSIACAAEFLPHVIDTVYRSDRN